ncbi:MULTISPECIES: DUF2357 domain-containing protein [unclassified Desulfurobacterium]|uniref:DUF2357 domain-containing protein n=1 Tax=Desulfurobacterium sp. TC5-1 TaxID=1158318 RepID=UPI0003B7545E|nr:DUF2357 domain-containing protein [Desulfurobacterium sp. TC5-1]
MKLIFAEYGFKKEEIKDTFKYIMDHLVEKDQAEIIGNTVVFKNFTGILETNKDRYLIIPRKLAEHFCLIDENGKPLSNFYHIYTNKFEKFLNYILEKLLKEQIIYTVGLAKFPVEESTLNDSKIFKLLLLLEKKDELINSLQLILSNPHRKLFEYKTYKSLEEISYINSEVITDICQSPERLYQTENGIFEYKGQKYSPISVLQYEVDETYDTLENRFVKLFLKELENILSEDLKDFQFILELQMIKENIEYALQSDIFSRVGDLSIFPSSSQVLMKKAGYREIFQIYRLLHISYIPKFFKDLDLAFSLKDMATLWEYYVLVKLLEEFKKEFGNYKVEIDFEPKKIGKTIYDKAKFSFNNGLVLHFQATKYTYSRLEFRPDFLIYFDDKNKKIVFDAKFRLFDNNNKSDIFKNMHYYRDGLQLDAAIAVCIGKENGEFYYENNNTESFNLTKVLKSLKNNSKKELKGIGYLTISIKEVYNETK